MEKFVTQALLFDFYGALLTDHQRKIFQDVVFDDLSLAEAADEAGVSRQAVHDIIKRCTKALEEYEEKLGLIALHQRVARKAEEIGTLAASASPEDLAKIAELAREIAEEV